MRNAQITSYLCYPPSTLNQCDGVLFKLAVVATRELASIGFHLLPFYFRSPVRKIEETSVGRGDQTPQALAERVRSAKTPMPYSSLQRLIIVARKQLNLPAASIDSLRHSFAT